MSKQGKATKAKTDTRSVKADRKVAAVNVPEPKKASVLPWVLAIVAVTALCLSPTLENEFTNWDDGAYVINNFLLRGPDWKGIFTQPVASNYHPITILSLAFNYQASGLNTDSYFLTNLILHLVNTVLVFYFIYSVSGGNRWVAGLTALIFGIHPMHVESVAWISERKDVLYTMFYLLSMIVYLRYTSSKRKADYWLCFGLFVLSLLAKPAAIVLPLVLLLLDYWSGRRINQRVVVEKVPFLLVSLLFAIVTVQIQSEKAIASVEMYPIWTRLFFAPYTLIVYLFRFIVPYPLSAYHPFPSVEHLGVPVLIAPLIFLCLAVFVWYKRKDKLIVFSLLFFAVNLLLVLQLVPIGSSIVSERYTYVPYIGLGFLAAMLLARTPEQLRTKLFIGVSAGVIAVMGVMTYNRTQVWNNSISLWSDVIDHYEHAPIPRTSRANAYLKMAGHPDHAHETANLYERALDDCAVARQGDEAFRKDVLETRGLTYLHMGNYKEAAADGDSVIQIEPGLSIGYSIRGTAYMNLNEADKAMNDFNKCLSIDQLDHSSYNNRGTILYNNYQKYQEAISDFSKAIELEPKPLYYLNRARCYYVTNNIAAAKKDAQTVMEYGMTIPEQFRQLLYK